MDECLHCTKLKHWLRLHCHQCRLTQCYLTLCKEMKKSQHLQNLSHPDHKFIEKVEGNQDNTPSPASHSHTPHSLQHYNQHEPFQFHRNDTLNPHPSLLATYQRSNLHHPILQFNGPESTITNGDDRNTSPNILSDQQPRILTSLGEDQPDVDQHSSHIKHNQDYHTKLSPQVNVGNSFRQSICNNDLSRPELRGRYCCNGLYDKTSSNSCSNFSGYAMHYETTAPPTTPQQYLTTPTQTFGNMGTVGNEGQHKMTRQYSNASSGYYTCGRQSVSSMSVMSQNDIEEEQDVCLEGSLSQLRVGERPERKSSAPVSSLNTSNRKKMIYHQSLSMTNFNSTYSLPTSYLEEEKREGEREYDRGASQPVVTTDCEYRERVVQPVARQSTGEDETKVVLENSFDLKDYKGVIRKRRGVKEEMTITESSDSPQSGSVTKRPLQREESGDVEGKNDKVLLGYSSGSLTRYHYDAIYKLRRDILGDKQETEKILKSKHKEELRKARQNRRSIMYSDIGSDFETESSTSDIHDSSSSQPNSSEFSELEDTSTDSHDEEKETFDDQCLTMTVEEQVSLIKRIRRDGAAGSVHSPTAVSNQPLSLIDAPYKSLQSRSFQRANTFESETSNNSTIRDEEDESIMSLAASDHTTATNMTSGGIDSTIRGSDESTLTTGSRPRSLKLSLSERSDEYPSLQQSSAHSSIPPLDDGQSSNTSYITHKSSDNTVHPSLKTDYKHTMTSEDSLLRRIHSSPAPSQSESDAERYSLTPPPPSQLKQPPTYLMSSSTVMEMCQTVDSVQHQYRDDLARIKLRDERQLMRQEPPQLTNEEKQRALPGNRFYIDTNVDLIPNQEKMVSQFPERERCYYKTMMREKFSEDEAQIRRELERRYLLKEHLTGKFHSGLAYREGIHWTKKTKLGKGGQAMCFSIQDLQTDLIMALKEAKEDRRTLDEAYTCMKLSYLSNVSQNIVDYYCAAMLPGEYMYCWSKYGMIQLFMELMPSCFYAFLLNCGPLTSEDIHHYGYQLFDALDYLHNKVRIIHCDIKPANLLLDFTAQRLKLTDFGFARLLSEYDTELVSDEKAGTLPYNPPEHYSRKLCSFALDIWQAGCTVLTMATGIRPWRHMFMDVVRSNQDPQLVDEMRKMQAQMIGQQTGSHFYPTFLDEPLKQLLHSCLQCDPKNRLTAKDCLHHLAVAGANKMADSDHRKKIMDAFGYWHSPSSLLNSYQGDTPQIDVYLETTTSAAVNGLRHQLKAGWLGTVPYSDGMTYEQLKNEVLLKHIPVLHHLSSPVQLASCDNSPQDIYMKTISSVGCTYTPAPPQSLVDRTKAIMLV